MAPTAFPGFVGPTYRSRTPIADAERCINWFPERIESGTGKNVYWLMPTPGMSLFADTPFGKMRAFFAQNGRTFTVVGSTFTEILNNGTRVDYGSVEADTGIATISSSGSTGNQLFITSGGKGYLFDLVGNVLSVAIPGLIADYGAYLAGFFIALNITDSQIRISEYADGATWDPTQFRARANGSDNWQAMLVIHNEIWLMGSQTYEVWYNAGTSPFPFTPIQGMFFNQGIASAATLVQIGESAAWLSSNNQGFGMVMLTDQYAPVRISNHSVEYFLQKFVEDGGSLSDADAMTYQSGGHTFLCISIPGMETSWAFDLTTKMWSERASWLSSPESPVSQWGLWEPNFCVNAFDRVLVGSRFNGKIYELSQNFFDDHGRAIRRMRRTPHLFDPSGKNLIVYYSFELDMQTGNGLATGQGSNPLVMLNISDDGGQTWGTEMMESSGAIGEYKQRVWFWGLGAARDAVFEITVSDPVAWMIVNAWVDFSVGQH